MVRRGRPPAGARGPTRLRGELLRSLDRVTVELDRGLRDSVLPPELLHELHRELRRLASGFVVWDRLVAASDGPGVAELARRLRRLARLVGRVRDHDVTAALLGRGLRRTTRGAEVDRWRGFLGRLREDAHTDRELLRAFLTSERQAGILERSRAALALTLRSDAARGLHHVLGEERRRRQGRVRRAHRKARRRPSVERLHRLRIRIRQWRHLASLEVAAGTGTIHPPTAAWRLLQARLGRLHDLDVAISSVPEALAEAAPSRRLRDERRELRRLVRSALERLGRLPSPMQGPSAAGASV